MLNPTEMAGTWWIPDRPHGRVRGTLTLGPDRFDLELHGNLHPVDVPAGAEIEYSDDLFGTWTTEPVVLGETDDHQLVTALDAAGFRATIPGFTDRETWRLRAALVGAHLATAEDLQFSAAYAEIQNLRVWAGAPDVPPNMVRDENSGRITGFRASVDRTVLGEVSLAEGSVTVAAEPKAKGMAGEVTLSLIPRVEFALKTPADWSAVLRDWVNPFRDLLILAAWSPCAIDGVWLERQHEGRRQVVELLVRTTDMRRPRRKDRRQGEFAYKLRDCPGGFDAVLQKFDELLTSHKATLPDIVALLSAPYLAEEDRFMAMAKIVEGLHVEQYGYTGVAKDAARAESDERIQRAVDAVPEDIRDWLTERLKGATPPMAKHRTLEIFSDLGPLGDKLAGGHLERFVFKVSMTRNFVMHRRAKDEPKALFGQQRLWHTFALELAVQACLVKHLGESDNTRLLARIARMPRFHSVVANLSDYYDPPVPALPTSDPAPDADQRASVAESESEASPAPARHEGWLRRLIRNVAKRVR